jgi:LuxR family transcriptional regulator, maltose regulon positive regulatory protein
MSIAHEMRKITCPALPPTILYRESLVTRLKEVTTGPAEGFPHYKLVLLYAPAGYGKTTLLADFARNTHIPCCWYFMDRMDADKNTFLEILLMSLRLRFPQFGAKLDPLLASAIAADAEGPARFHYEAMIDALIAAIETEITERFALILCNYQEMSGCQEVNELVNHFLRKLPESCVLIIESRATPELDFALLLAHREMVGIGSNLLRFTAQEIRDLALLQGVTEFNEAQATQLALSFEGWITGILLGAHLGGIEFLPQWSHENEKQGSLVDRHHLFSYVVSEVFERNPELYSFLKEASVLQEMTPSLCAKLLGIQDAARHLHYLEQNGLFVTRRGEEEYAAYTCHPVLRELLYNDLRQQMPERFIALHQRAAQLLSADKNYEKAVYHAFEAKAYDLVSSLIIECYDQMLKQGHAGTLARWIDELPPTTTMHNPRLLLIRANIHLMVGEQICALSLLDTASIAIMKYIEPEQIPQLQIEIVILRSKALFQHGDYHQALVLCQEIQERLPTNDSRMRADVHTRLGVCANLLGDFTTGIAQLQKALQLWGRHTIERQTAELHSALASAYSLVGNFALAEHHISRAIAYWGQLHDEWGKINNVIRQGGIKQRQGVFAEAEEAFTQALTLARGSIHFLRGEAYSQVSLGELYQDQGLYEQSLNMIEDGLALARRIKDKYLINCTLCFLAMTYLYMGDAETALLLVSDVDVQDMHATSLSYEQAVCELAYGTILLYQQRYDDAYCHLSKVEASLNKMGLKRELIQAILRMALCLLEQGQTNEWMQRMEEIVHLLKVQNGYKHLVFIELRHLTRLYQVVETHPEMGNLREQLDLVPDMQKTAPQQLATPAPALIVELDQPVPSVVQVITNHPKISIRALGEPSVAIEDRPITRWRMARSMELFFFLLDCERPMRKEQIITGLWSEVDEQINQTFHSTIYYLRKALDGHGIVSQGSTYTLNLAAYFGTNVWYDVTEFQQQHARAKQALSQDDDIVAREALQTMLELYRGDYVQLFYSDWCTFRRDELRRMYLDARCQLAKIAWRQEKFDECALHWQHTLMVDDCLEEAHYGLMRCYLRQGKRGLALRQYQRCRDTLQREMDILPGSAVQNLYQRLMSPS